MHIKTYTHISIHLPVLVVLVFFHSSMEGKHTFMHTMVLCSCWTPPMDQ